MQDMMNSLADIRNDLTPYSANLSNVPRPSITETRTTTFVQHEPNESTRHMCDSGSQSDIHGSASIGYTALELHRTASDRTAPWSLQEC